MKPTSTAMAATTALAAATLLAPAAAHSFMFKPEPRDHMYHADTFNEFGCPVNTVGPVTEFKAGETIDVRHWRNNHIGGFIRYSIAPRGDESKETFDKNAFFYSCRESGPECVPTFQPNEIYTPDGSGDNTIACGDQITLPDWLPEGDYVLQWTWFGVGLTYGQIGLAESQFRSCSDIRLTSSGDKSAAPACPTFRGGDRMTKALDKGNDVCLYYYTNDIVAEQFVGDNEGAAERYKYGVPGDVERCVADKGADADADEGGDDGNATVAPIEPDAPEPEPTTTPEPATLAPTATPAVEPTEVPEPLPTEPATLAPTVTPEPSMTPAVEPTDAPEPLPTEPATLAPTNAPKPEVTEMPEPVVTMEPTDAPQSPRPSVAPPATHKRGRWHRRYGQ